MKILITGGHLAPALAIIEELKKQKSRTEIVFVGGKFVLDDKKTLTLEYKSVIRKKIKFISLETGRATRILSFRSLKNFFKFPLGLVGAEKIIREEKPDLILSFGGYLALPVALSAFLHRIPVYTHEQTINPGLTNRIISLFAKKIFLSFDNTKKYFNPKKTIVSGNPIRQTVFQTIKKPFEIKKEKPVIYFTGGSLGSHSINWHLKNLLPKLLKDYIIVHQTGDTKEYQDFEILSKIKKKLPETLKKNYFLSKHFYDDEIGYIYQTADLVVGRAGANTFFELLALKKPAIFIPLPWSANKEQQQQAELFKKAGLGEIFSQSDKSENLYRLIKKMIKNLNVYKDCFKKLTKPFNKNDAAKIIIKEISSN
ncbi:MAG: UDP-N-acetylglucosamine--N-acetylmuramyl-(pentapeptide) pyrophosphoryl-undecaprenol N-acetylglucosamine transferase [Microgenomates group bacterium]|nr:UDP-N-acetylglucosamine--N-acetylmuramyl-(pentapeptide) pyrophosphoryl-undecaprenol N-acetylglucosamine transferase [Microgenomates group bacterium]